VGKGQVIVANQIYTDADFADQPTAPATPGALTFADDAFMPDHANGLDASKPVDDSPLGFMEQVHLAYSEKPSEKVNYLAKQFGKDNVRYNSDTGEIAVNKDGYWHKAQSSGLAEFVGGSAAPMAGAVAGAEVGAAAGTAILPGIGTAAGAVLGAGVGAMIGKAANINDAYRMGLRTEGDAADVAKELGKEFLLGAAGEGAGRAIFAVGAKGAELVSNAMSKVAKNAVTPAAKEKVVAFVSKTTGVDPVDVSTWLDHAPEVKTYQQKELAWEQSTRMGTSPVRKEMAQTATESIDSAKKAMYSQFDQGFKEFKPILEKGKTDISPVVGDMLDQFGELGLVNPTNGSWMETGERSISSVVSPTTINKLKQAHGIVERAAKDGAQVSLKDARTLVQNFDEMAEAMSSLKGDFVSSPAQRQIFMIRDNIENSLINGLKQVDEKAATRYVEMNTTFSQQRQLLDEAISMGASNPKSVDKFVEKMINGKGGSEQGILYSLINSTSKNADDVITKLRQMRAGINTTNIFSKSSQGNIPGSSALIGSIGGGIPGAIVGGAAGLATSSPRYTAPMAAQTFQALKGMATGVSWMNSLPVKQRSLLLQNPKAMSTLFQTMEHAIVGPDQVKNEMLNTVGGPR
jgi:hypothetical protein